MSELKRLEFIKSADCDMGCDCRLIPDPVECKDGRFVFYSDYARLKAEVERLRKAGDAMADFFVPDIDDLGHNYGFKKSVESVISNWNAAKEGKGQP